MIQIKPINIGFPAKIGTQVEVSNMTYIIGGDHKELLYKIFSKDGEKLADGNVPFSNAQYALWGDDDAHVENLVLIYLKLTRL